MSRNHKKKNAFKISLGFDGNEIGMLKRTLNDDICQVRFQIRKVSVLSLVDSATTMGRTVIGHLEAIN